MKSAPDLFSVEDRKLVFNAIRSAELKTSGELRVYVDDECKGDVLDRAAFVFAQLKMHETKLRNGVLIYLAVKDHKFAIIGDAGINALTGNDFWNKIKDQMLVFFKENKFTEGLVYGVQAAGDALVNYFPRTADDKNELADDMIFGSK